MAEETRLQRLEDIKARFAGNDAVLPLVESAINKTKIQQGVAPKEVVAQALLTLSKAMTQASMSGQNLDEDAIKRAVREDLAKNKIGIDELDETLKKLIKGKETTINLTVSTASGTVKIGQVKAKSADLANPLVQLILSDICARNNVYLYGPAGTGKTYIAEVISKLMAWPLITVTCNQFTSPLNLIGGQTIEGYQEGLVTKAWGNILQERPVPQGEGQPPKMMPPAGNILLLDELPKLDPNTAGVMNDALAKVKRRGSIENGKGEKIPMGNCFIIATGNVKLNEIDEDYVANFKQDLSLQDRFVGSCYPIIVQYGYQVEDIMKGFLFIWEYMTDLQKAIKKEGFSAQAFVSNRIMESLRDTTMIAVGNFNGAQIQPVEAGILERAKSLMQGVRSFLSLFSEDDRKRLEEGVDIEVERATSVGGGNQIFETFTRKSQSLADFTNIVNQKMATTPNFDVPKDDDNYGFDTPEELENARNRAKAHDSIQLKVYEQ